MTEDLDRSGRNHRRANSSMTALSAPRNIVWLGLTIISVTLFVAAARVSITVRDIQTRIAMVERFTQADTGPDLELVRSNIGAIRNDLSIIRADVGWLFPVSPALSWLPQVGGDLAASGDLFNMTDAFVQSADTLLGVATRIAGGNSVGTGAGPTDLVDTLDEVRPQLQLARNLLNTAAYYRARIAPSMLSTRTLALVDQFDRIMPFADVAAAASLGLPELLGVDGSRAYLIVAQNEDERRATGGFVSAAGLVTFERGILTSLEFIDSYQVDDLAQDYPPAPAALEKYMLAGYWLFRDANWSPDFPTSARHLAAFYEMGTGRHLDGVVALDQEMVRRLVQATGPFDVPEDPPSHVDASNVLSIMRESWAPPVDVPSTQAFRTRKNFIGNMAKSLQSHLLEGDRPNASAVARAVYDALRGRHLLLYMPGSPLSNALERIGWDGSMRSSTSDYLMVVDSNMGFNKADALVSRQYNYQVIFDSDLKAHSSLTIQYRHEGTPAAQVCIQRVPEYGPATTYESLMNQCYWDYLRVYVPSGSALFDATRYPIPAARMLNGKDSTGDPELIGPDNGRSAFATFFMLEPGEAKNMNFEYDLPRAIIQPGAGGMETYRLYWQKQPGTAAIPIQFGLTLPRGSSVIRVTTPASITATRDESGDGLRLNYSFVLDADAAIDVQFLRN